MFKSKGREFGVHHCSQQNLKLVMLIDQDKKKRKQIHIWNPMIIVSPFIMFKYIISWDF